MGAFRSEGAAPTPSHSFLGVFRIFFFEGNHLSSDIVQSPQRCSCVVDMERGYPRGRGGTQVWGCANEAKLLDTKKVLQARPWPKKSPTAQNVTQKKSN